MRGGTVLGEPRVFSSARLVVCPGARSARVPRGILRVRTLPGSPNVGVVECVVRTPPRSPHRALARSRPVRARVGRRRAQGRVRRGRREHVLAEPSPGRRHGPNRDHPTQDAHEEHPGAQRGRQQPGAAAHLVLSHAPHRHRWVRAAE